MIPINIHIQHFASLKGAISNKLPKAAARRRAPPSQRKPSRCIFSTHHGPKDSDVKCRLSLSSFFTAGIALFFYLIHFTF
jgi:hypothetical protein